jgi:beta-phosphoglucomutase family hydrolase
VLNDWSPPTRLGVMQAVIFDLDGVVTRTAGLHADAWKQLFDTYLRARARRLGEPFQPFDLQSDYRRFVDGKPRYEGVRSFLASRGIELPFGSPQDGPEEESVCGLGNRKDRHFRDALARTGGSPYPTTLELVAALRRRGVPTAVVSSSRNCEVVLEAAGIRELFDVKVDGVDAADLGLSGKPDPAVFLEAARRLGVAPACTAVVEDALAGVEAARRGGFGLVVGVDRADQAENLAAAGADFVVGDLAQVAV